LAIVDANEIKKKHGKTHCWGQKKVKKDRGGGKKGVKPRENIREKPGGRSKFDQKKEPGPETTLQQTT